MIARLVLPAGICLIAAGCTHWQLAQSTTLTASTVMDIEYRIVLQNLAMMSCHPDSLPCHIGLDDGVVQINDEAAFGGAGGFTTFNGVKFGIDQFGPNAGRQVTEQWGADPTTDPERLVELQALYRAALGIPPLMLPNAIIYLRTLAEQEKANGNGNGNGNNGSRQEESENGSSGPASTASTGGGGSTPSAGGSSSGDGGERKVPIEILLSDVPPPGWYRIGSKSDVPKNACYVANFGKRYAWVTPDGMPGLARFTLTVLSVVKFQPGAGAGRNGGLAVTR